jgi:hypothetical protein
VWVSADESFRRIVLGDKDRGCWISTGPVDVTLEGIFSESLVLEPGCSGSGVVLMAFAEEECSETGIESCKPVGATFLVQLVLPTVLLDVLKYNYKSHRGCPEKKTKEVEESILRPVDLNGFEGPDYPNFVQPAAT